MAQAKKNVKIGLKGWEILVCIAGLIATFVTIA